MVVTNNLRISVARQEVLDHVRHRTPEGKGHVAQYFLYSGTLTEGKSISVLLAIIKLNFCLHRPYYLYLK